MTPTKSIFDPKTFGQMTFEGQNDTKTIPIPVGDWPFEIKKQEIVAWQKKDDPTVGGLKCVLFLETAHETVVEATGRPKNVARYELMLDLTPEGGLDFGKGMNAKLGRAREACGLNRPGQPFAFDMFIGHQVTAQVAHSEYQGDLQANVKGIAKIG